MLLSVLPVIADLLRAVAWLFSVAGFRIRSRPLHQPSVPHWCAVNLSVPRQLLHITVSLSLGSLYGSGMPLLAPFGSLLNAIFLCPNLSIATKRIIYRTAVISSLLYGSDTWAVYAGHIYRLEILHHSFVCAILGVPWDPSSSLLEESMAQHHCW